MQLAAIVRGDYEEIEVELRNPTEEEDLDGEIITEPRDIRNDRLVFKARFSLKDASPIFTKTSDDTEEVEKTEPLLGKAVIKIQPEDTVSVPSNKTLKCTLEVIDFLGRPATTFHDLPVTWRNT